MEFEILFVTAKKDAEDRSILPKFIYLMNSNQKIKKPTLNSGME